MRFRKELAFLIFISVTLMNNLTVFADSSSCIKDIKSLQKTKNDAELHGGVWTLFETNPELRNDSRQGLALDSKVNEMIHHVKYLCETLDGVPLNEIAHYVSEKLKTMGKEKFRQQLRIFGKPEKEIEIWFKFTELSQKIKLRTLNSDSVKNTIHRTKDLIEEYMKLFTNDLYKNSVKLASITQDMLKRIEAFLANDSNMALAIYEKSQVPFWDIDENYGGS